MEVVALVKYYFENFHIKQSFRCGYGRYTLCRDESHQTTLLHMYECKNCCVDLCRPRDMDENVTVWLSNNVPTLHDYSFNGMGNVSWKVLGLHLTNDSM